MDIHSHCTSDVGLKQVRTVRINENLWETMLTLARDYAMPLGLRSMWKTDHDDDDDDDDLMYCK
jgi:hypothetical protein